MPLILAIEPDRKQAARITLLARGLPGTELMLTDSTEQALATLDGRVPNLILTSLLLSPKDEAGLRTLSGAGVPVPTLMIPMFATATLQAHERSGFLARLPWSRAGATNAAPGTAGCDPSVFASQIWEYLQSTAHEDELIDPLEDAPQKCDEDVELAPNEDERPAALGEVQGLALSEAEEPLALAPPDAPDEQVLQPDATPVSWEEISLDDEPSAAIELSGETIDLRAFVQELEAAELEFSQPPAFDAIGPIEAVEVVDVVELEAADTEVVDQPDEPIVADCSVDDSVIDDSVIAAAEPATVIAAVIEEPEEPVIPRMTLAHALPDHASWPPLEGMLAEEMSPEELLAIVADFEAALEDEPDNPGNVDADSDLWMPLSVGGTTSWPRLENACSRPRAHQDEWGFFDPEQCGFSALVARLDQISK